MDNIYNWLASLYDSINYPIEVINEDGYIVYINKAFIFQWGYTLPELKEYSVFNDSELKKTDAIELISRSFREGSEGFITGYNDSLIKSKESVVPILRTKYFPLKSGKQKYIVLFHEDQTELFLTEEEIKKSRDANKEAERLKNTFLNVLSHELRTPLNIILGYSSIIKESLKDKINSEDKIYLDNLYSGSERLFKSITQMLEFAQIEAGNYNVIIEPIDLLAILKSSVNIIAPAASQKNIDIKLNFKADRVFVNADIHSTESAINDLLNNAVKFTRQGFIEIEVNTLEDKDLAIVRVKDSGIGIASEYLDHIFRPFSQEDLKIGRNFEGNGLGLALSKRYIERMGGSLLVDSIKGVGTTFTFTLPLAQGVTKNEAKNNSGEMQANVLLIDGASESYGLLNAFLKNTYYIKTVDYKTFDFNLLKTEIYKVIVFDVNPYFWEESLLFCSKLKKMDPFKRPVIVISSEFIEEKIEEFYKVGADKFLIKPFSKSDLLKELNFLSNNF